MSLSPWDVGSVFSFEFAAYHSRKNSLIRATRGRKRPTSYRRAVQQIETRSGCQQVPSIDLDLSSVTSGIAEEDDYIEKILQRPSQPELRVDTLLSPPKLKNDSSTVATTAGGIGAQEPGSPSLLPHRHNITIALNDEPIDRIKTRCRSPVCKNVQGVPGKGGGVEICRGCRNTTGPRIRRNLISLCVAYILVYAAFRALQNLICTVHYTYGPICMALLYITMSLSCLGVPQYTDRLNPKWCILLGVLSYLIWLGCNLKSSIGLLIPAALIAGAGQTIVWNAQLVYLSTLYRDYYEIKQKAAQQISRYNSIFLACFQTTHIWGNLAVTLILHNWTEELDIAPHAVINTTAISRNNSLLLSNNNISNLEQVSSLSPMDRSCGKFDCDTDYTFGKKTLQLADKANVCIGTSG